MSWLLLLWCPHLARSSSCSSGRLGSSRSEEAWRSLHGGVSSSVEQDIGVAGHHLTLLHHGDGTVIKQTPACGTGRGGEVRNERLTREWYKRRTELREEITLFRTTNSHIRTGMNLIDCTLTNIAALAVLVTWQPSVGCVVTSYHSSIVVDDCIQVVDRGLLHLILLANTELTQIQVPRRQGYIRGLAIKMGENWTRSTAFNH